MRDPAEELAAEQHYFDIALDRREKQRQGLQDMPEAGVSKGDAAELREFRDSVLKRMQPPDAAVAFGRFDTESGETWYLGYDSILDENYEPLVINWKADAAEAYFEASADHPMGVRFKRYFETDGNTILDFDDLFLQEIAADVTRLLQEPKVEDALLKDLERKRTGEMHDIVRTIQASQSKLMRTDLDRFLVVQGGPGTGKTAVALHRVAWLLYKYDKELSPADVLVVGPNLTFLRYIRNVLPGLGDHNVQHSDRVGLLAAAVRVTIEDPLGLARMKGETRMITLIQSGLQDRIGIPPGLLDVRTPAGVVALDRSAVEELVEKSMRLAYNTGRQRLREHARTNAVDQVGPEGTSGDALDNFVDRIWPPMTAASFLQELFGSEGRLLRAAGDLFSAAEVQMLYRRAAERLSEQPWSREDLALLDYADELIRGAPPATFLHVVLDEAQDLSPMELLMIARRCPTGSMTVLGDLAQSTGPWARDSWEDVIDLLQRSAPLVYEELEHGYRVPRQIYEVAERVLPQAAADVSPPRVVRDGPTDPEIIRQIDPGLRASLVVDKARGYAADGNSVGIITPAGPRPEIIETLERLNVQWMDAAAGELGSGINLLNPLESKGLEFDAVIVVEPDLIIAEEQRGHRLLYVALTRATKHLTVISSGAGVGMDGEPPAGPAPGPAGGSEGGAIDTQENPLVTGIARGLAQDIRRLVNRDARHDLLEALKKELGE